MSDGRLRAIERALRADPTNEGLRAVYRRERERVDGRIVALPRKEHIDFSEVVVALPRKEHIDFSEVVAQDSVRFFRDFRDLAGNGGVIGRAADRMERARKKTHENVTRRPPRRIR